jgi:spore maturation protein CgeB
VAAGIEYAGWLPNYEAPEVFARFGATVHVPRRPYAHALPGIPTIRVFEALACGIPLVSAPWLDSENLFRPGDYVSVDSPQAMWEALHRFATDDDAREEQAAVGLETILARHTCRHRAEQLLDIIAELGTAGAAGSFASTEAACT